MNYSNKVFSVIENEEKRYNQAYINDFDESVYLKYLSDEYIIDLFESFCGLEKDALWLALKESLDHYVKKRLLNDLSFMESSEFHNYLKFIHAVSEDEEIFVVNGKEIPMELCTNVVFKDEELRNILFERIGKQYGLKEKYEEGKHEIDTIFLKMSQNIVLDDSSIQVAAKYLYLSRDFSEDKANVFLKYILNNRNKFHSLSSYSNIIAAIATILPKFYSLNEDIKNIRFFVAKYYDKKRICKAGSSFNQQIGIIEPDYAESVSLGGTDYLTSSRVSDYNDLISIILVIYHELTHQYQRLERKKEFISSAGLSDTFFKVLSKMKSIFGINYYDLNHDADEIEIGADEEAWKQVVILFEQLDIEGKDEVITSMRKNAKEIEERRSFSRKIDPVTYIMNGEEENDHFVNSTYYVDFDVMYFIGLIQEKPWLLNVYPILNNIFDSNGNLKVLDLMTSGLAYTKRKDLFFKGFSIYTGNSKEIDYNDTWVELASYILFNEKTWNELMKPLNDGKVEAKDILDTYRVMTSILAVVRNSIQKIYHFHDADSRGFYGYGDIVTRFDYSDPEMIREMYKKHFVNIVLGIIRYYQYKEIVENDLKQDILDNFDFDMVIPSSVDELSNNLIEIVGFLDDKEDVESILELLKNSNLPECIEIYDRVKGSLSTGSFKEK